MGGRTNSGSSRDLRKSYLVFRLDSVGRPNQSECGCVSENKPVNLIFRNHNEKLPLQESSSVR